MTLDEVIEKIEYAMFKHDFTFCMPDIKINLFEVFHCLAMEIDKVNKRMDDMEHREDLNEK